RRVQFTQIEQAALHCAISCHPHAFTKRIIRMDLPILPNRMALDEHSARIMRNREAPPPEGRLSHTRFRHFPPCKCLKIREASPEKSSNQPQTAKLGLSPCHLEPGGL